ncbi:Arm DNA-binding domain-containing protein [Alistipes communis]|uniref:Arm DNA-binding domain-containing protein n=1 Tax=Alistipes communis TaxID=2585118 RepID=UPI00320A3241
MSASIPFTEKPASIKTAPRNIYQRFTVDRRSRYVSTGISIPADDRDFDIPTLKIQNPAVQLRIYERIEKYASIERLEALEVPAQRSATCRKPTAGGFIA